MIRNPKSKHKLCVTANLSNSVYGVHVPMGDRIRNALDNGVSESAITPSVFDDDGTSSIDPSSNIRTDKWDQIEQAGDRAYFDQFKAPTTAESSEVTNSTAESVSATSEVQNVSQN